MGNHPQGPLLTTAEAADNLRISVRHLRRLVSRGTLVAFRIGETGRPRFRHGDLDRLLTASRPAVAEDGDLRDYITKHTTRG